MSFATKAAPGRVFRLSRNADPTKLTEWRYLANAEPGRWADPEGEYRVLYTADSELGAFVEVLQDLRPRQAALDLIEAIEDDGDFGDVLSSVEAAARERLRQYYFAALLPSPHDLVVDLEHAASRTEIEHRLAEDLAGKRIKVGDFSAGDYNFTRRVSRLVYTSLTTDKLPYAAVSARSAEHPPSHCYTYYETGRETDELRGTVYPHFVRQALDEHEHVREALAYIGP
jgi:RES domain